MSIATRTTVTFPVGPIPPVTAPDALPRVPGYDVVRELDRGQA